MKYLIVLCVLLSFSFESRSAWIGADDVDSITFQLPDGWTAVNESALFDGITRKRKSERFIGYRNQSVDLTAENPFQINVDFNKLFDISSFSFYNDWGYHLQQQVASITIDFFDSVGQTIFSNTRNDVQLDTFDVIEIFNTSNTILNVAAISVKISDIQKTNFEIREFVLEATRSQTDDTGLSQVSAPLVGAFVVSLFGIFMIFRRNV